MSIRGKVHQANSIILTVSLIHENYVPLPVYSQVGSCHKRQKPHAPTPQAPIRDRQMRKVANAKDLNRNTNLT